MKDDEMDGVYGRYVWGRSVLTSGLCFWNLKKIRSFENIGVDG